jgi:hypothetical protein
MSSTIVEIILGFDSKTTWTHWRRLQFQGSLNVYHISNANSQNVTASFRNTGIAACADNEKPVECVRVENYRCLLHPFTISDLEKFDHSLLPNPELGDVAESADLVCSPFWLQALKEEASRFRESEA